MLTIVRHAESIENATKYNGFYRNPRPYNGEVAHIISQNLIGLTPQGFYQAQQLGAVLNAFTAHPTNIFVSQYRRAQDTARIALPQYSSQTTALLNEQHYGDATYMTKEELFSTYPHDRKVRTEHKHTWIPRGGGESLLNMCSGRATQFVTTALSLIHSGIHVIAITHHTTIMALRCLIEQRPIEDIVCETRKNKIPNCGILRYRLNKKSFSLIETLHP